jgi:ATP-binding cassette subfamily F protein 3
MDELSPGKTPYDHFLELMPEATEAERRARLGAYGFGAQLANNKVETLSGGEKARLLFALAAFHGPNILVLDEPTNHLDISAREALVHALNDYEGAVILISHDRHLIEASVDRLWLVDGGTVSLMTATSILMRNWCWTRPVRPARSQGRSTRGKGQRRVRAGRRQA